ncbi:MAG: hypothetical protein HY329_24700 [Chloroflexi bacterium]|nr:hypothetical protein [Chloroflexota bacterium]
MLRLGIGERGVAEILAVAEHTAGLCAGAAGFGLRPDAPDGQAASVNAFVRLLDEETAGDAAATLAEIRAWARDTLGFDRAPAFWRALAHQPRLLAATWAKHRLVMNAGELDAATKVCLGLAVATFKQSDYWIAYFGRLARRSANLDDAGLVEVTGAVMHYVSFNTIAHGMRLEPPFTDLSADELARS